ncbi:hypothetical protein BgiMline_011493 [Biomphalaria glabrata]
MESELETRTSGVLVSLADSPNAGSRTQSAAGADILFEAKKKKKQSTSSLAGQDDGYEVTFTVTIAMAVPTVYEDQDGQTPSPVAGLCLKDLLKGKQLHLYMSPLSPTDPSCHYLTCIAAHADSECPLTRHYLDSLLLHLLCVEVLTPFAKHNLRLITGDPLANCLAESARSSNIQQHKSRRAQLIGSRHITCTICFSQHLLT